MVGINPMLLHRVELTVGIGDSEGPVSTILGDPHFELLDGLPINRPFTPQAFEHGSIGEQSFVGFVRLLPGDGGAVSGGGGDGRCRPGPGRAS